MKKKKILILDSHALLHRAYHGLPEFYNSKGFPTGALYGTVSTILSVLKEFNPEYVFAAYDLPKPTYRHELYKNYKASRPKILDDLSVQIQKSKEILKNFGFDIYEKQGYEADDIIATLVQKLKKQKDHQIIIVSGDMDTMQLVDDKKVLVYTFKRSLKDTILYDEEAVIKRFGFAPIFIPDFKGLKGDPSDNIVGVKGIGDKTATKLIQLFGSIENIYKAIDKNDSKLKEFKERIIHLLKEGREEALFSKMLATVKSDVNIDFSLPQETWKEKINIENLHRIFDELDFRSLKVRLNELIDFSDSKTEEIDTETILFKRCAVCLWLLNSNKTEPSPEDILSYTSKNSLQDAYKVLLDKLKKEQLDKVFFEIEDPLIPVIDKINKTGIMIDKVYFKNLEKEFAQTLKKLESKIHKLAGVEFNVRSPKQLAEVLFNNLGIKSSKKTSTGQPKTDEKTLNALKNKHEIIPIILQYREIHKLYSTYVEAILKQVDKDLRIRTTFIQTGTTTGRLASKNPNLQNIPTRTHEGKRIRKGFIPQKGYKLVSLDYSQIELRIAAILSGDKELIKIFKENKDIHKSVAAKIFKVKENEVTQQMRNHAKVINFGILYGMGIRALKENLGEEFSLEDAKKYLQNYFETFSGLKDWIDKTIQETKKIGYTQTLFGRKRYFLEINSKIEYIKKAAERMATNAPIQGTQADMIKISMWQIDNFITENSLAFDAKMVLQIHDEIMLEVKEEKLEKVCLSAKNIMENVLPKEKQIIPIKVDIKVGDSWGDLQKISDTI